MGISIPVLLGMLPYLTTVPHVDEGAHGVEGTCPTGQQVCSVVGMQHTDIVGTVSLGERKGHRVSVPCPSPGPAPSWGPRTVWKPQPRFPGLLPRSLPPAWCQGSGMAACAL